MTFRNISKSILAGAMLALGVMLFVSLVWPLILILLSLVAIAGLSYWVYLVITESDTPKTKKGKEVNFPDDWEVEAVEEAKIVD